jgi:hypothetical protein
MTLMDFENSASILITSGTAPKVQFREELCTTAIALYRFLRPEQ